MEYQTEKIRYISHEVKNQLSICDLYAEILTKYCDKNNIKDETILKSVNCIKTALKLAGSSLLELKSSQTINIDTYRINELLEKSCELSKVYGQAKGVNINLENLPEDIEVKLDKDRFICVLINLVKNACEAFKNEENKKIAIRATSENSLIKISVSNNASPILEPEKIFSDGFTTKSSGTGAGLYIAKKNMEEMSGYLKLIQSNKIKTVFEAGIKV